MHKEHIWQSSWHFLFHKFRKQNRYPSYCLRLIHLPEFSILLLLNPLRDLAPNNHFFLSTNFVFYTLLCSILSHLKAKNQSSSHQHIPAFSYCPFFPALNLLTTQLTSIWLLHTQLHSSCFWYFHQCLHTWQSLYFHMWHHPLLVLSLQPILHGRLLTTNSLHLTTPHPPQIICLMLKQLHTHSSLSCLFLPFPFHPPPGH